MLVILTPSFWRLARMNMSQVERNVQHRQNLLELQEERYYHRKWQQASLTLAELVHKLDQVVPRGFRSRFVQHLLEAELSEHLEVPQK